MTLFSSTVLFRSGWVKRQLRAPIHPTEFAASGRERAAQLGQYRLAVRAHTAPEEERLGSLLDQHAQAIQGTACALLDGPAVEGGWLFGVHHVVAQRVMGPDQARGDGGRLAR